MLKSKFDLNGWLILIWNKRILYLVNKIYICRSESNFQRRKTNGVLKTLKWYYRLLRKREFGMEIDSHGMIKNTLRWKIPSFLIAEIFSKKTNLLLSVPLFCLFVFLNCRIIPRNGYKLQSNSKNSALNTTLRIFLHIV